jgi:hypothetical protein
VSNPAKSFNVQFPLIFKECVYINKELYDETINFFLEAENDNRENNKIILETPEFDEFLRKSINTNEIITEKLTIQEILDYQLKCCEPYRYTTLQGFADNNKSLQNAQKYIYSIMIKDLKLYINGLEHSVKNKLENIQIYTSGHIDFKNMKFYFVVDSRASIFNVDIDYIKNNLKDYFLEFKNVEEDMLIQNIFKKTLPLENLGKDRFYGTLVVFDHLFLFFITILMMSLIWYFTH